MVAAPAAGALHALVAAEHDAAPTPTRGLTDAQKEWVRQSYDGGLKTTGQLLRRLNDMRYKQILPVGLDIPEKQKLQNFLVELKKRISAEFSGTLIPRL